MENRGFIEQLKHRKFWRVLIAYPVVVFGLLEALEFFIDNYGLDARWLTAGLIAAITLLPAALIWNWRHGESGQQPVHRIESIAYVLIFGVMLVAVIGWFRQAPVPDTSDAHRQTAGAVSNKSSYDEMSADASRMPGSIAVMPLMNVSGDPDLQYLCDGIAESLTNWLSRRDGLRVASKSAAFRLRDEADMASIAETLSVDALVRGRLEQVNDRWVASISVTRAQDESQIWGDRLTVQGDDVLALERSLVEAIQAGLSMDVFDDGSAVDVGGTNDPVAYEHYLRGHYLIQSTEGDALDEGLDELRAAIQADPQFARPYADIADNLAQRISYGQRLDERLVGEARAAAYTAAALAPNLSEAQTAVATVAQFIDLDWSVADAGFERAVALGPTSTLPYTRYSEYLLTTLRFQKSREMAAASMELDPLSSAAMHAEGVAQMFSGEFEKAVDVLDDWNRYVPGSVWAHIKYALALSLAGDCDKAAEPARIAVQRIGDQPAPLMDSWLAWGFSLCGASEHFADRKARIDAWVADHPDTLDPGQVYLAALEGDAQAVLRLTERVIDTDHPFTGFLQVFVVDFMGFRVADELRQNKRYLELLAGLNFPPPDPGYEYLPEH